MSRVLVIEDEPKIRRSLERGLRVEGHAVVTAGSGEDGFLLASREAFDCLVLDLLLPGRDGLQVLADLRREGNRTPVLILTARDTVPDRVLGLDLVKPFAFPELLARVRALLRRDRDDRPTRVRADDLEVDLLQRRAVRGGAEICLTQREFEVLAYLLRHKNRVVTRDMLGRDVWREPNHALTNVIDVYINLLRRKLERPGARPLIHTLRGVGYSLRDEPCL
jgi:two-component system copper resistance phosphate regulon response regulator CusR